MPAPRPILYLPRPIYPGFAELTIPLATIQYYRGHYPKNVVLTEQKEIVILELRDIIPAAQAYLQRFAALNLPQRLKLLVLQTPIETAGLVKALFQRADCVLLTQHTDQQDQILHQFYQFLGEGYSIHESYIQACAYWSNDVWKIIQEERLIEAVGDKVPPPGLYLKKIAPLPRDKKGKKPLHTAYWCFRYPIDQPVYAPTHPVLDQLRSTHSARLKDIFIELEEYSFFHSPSGIDRPDHRLIGREFISNRLRTIFTNSRSKAGAYLLTGYRGMGKTSMVRNILREIQLSPWSKVGAIVSHYKKHKKLISLKKLAQQHPKVIIEISMAQDDLKDIDVLRTLAKKLQHQYRKFRKPFGSLRGATELLVKVVLSIAWIRFVISSDPDFTWLLRYGPDFLTTFLSERFWLGVRWGLGAAIGLASIWLFRFLIRKIQAYLGIITHKHVLQRLDWLNEKIESNITLEQSQELNPVFQTKLGPRLNFRTSNKSVAAFPIASAKEIEGELVSIFHEIDQLGISQWMNKTVDAEWSRWRKRWHYFLQSWLYIPDIVVIFDELDKIEPHYNISILEKEAEDPEIALNSEGIYAPETTRRRQEAIALLLSNLKHFLNVAKAKFIFIAGREMYDASLADISDRETFWSSIFHEVLYLRSFLKDKVDQVSSGITSMTEEYICNILIPGTYQRTIAAQQESPFSPTLAAYYQYLKAEVFALSSPQWQIDKSDLAQEIVDDYEQELEKMAKKILYTTQNLIIYLTYRSNGTPKTISSMFEALINTRQYAEILNKPHNLVVSRQINQIEKQGLFIRFTDQTQYKVGLITYLFRPYLIANSRYIKQLGDKLLVSTSFLMDHLFKFHAFGFSWRSLELTPEIITINKAPELRSFIEKLLHALLQLHLREVESGLFQFKFYNKIAQEISYISKVSELESAAFNFTLDESLLIKRHYKKKLYKLKESVKNHPRNVGKNEYIHSIGFIDSILGDLHFYDQEYDDAIVQFDDAIQFLRHEEGNLSIHQFILLIRNRLKIGLILEKMKSYNSALISYEEIIREIPRYLSTSDFGIPGTGPESSQKIIYEGITLLFLPFIARLHVLEKGSLAGLGFGAIQRNIKDLELITQNISTPFSNLVEANYFRHVGSILYYKNGWICQDANSSVEWQNASLPIAQIHHWFCLDLEAITVRDFNAPVSAYQHYHVALQLLIPPQSGSSAAADQSPLPKSLFVFLARLKSYRTEMPNPRGLNLALGETLSKMGDCILAFISHKPGQQELSFDLDFFAKLVNTELESENLMVKLMALFKQLPQNNATIEWVFFHYWLSSLFFLKGGKTISFEFQLRKILYSLKDWLSFSQNPTQKYPKNNPETTPIKLQHLATLENQKILDRVLEDLVTRLYRAISWANDGTNRPQIFKYRDVFGIPGQTSSAESKSIYNNISNNPETKEVSLLLAEIKLKLAFKFRDTTEKYFEKQVPTLNYTIVNPYCSIHSRFVRVRELVYRSQLNFYYFTELGFRQFFEQYDLLDKTKRKLQSKKDANSVLHAGEFDPNKEPALYETIKNTTATLAEFWTPARRLTKTNTLLKAFGKPIELEQALSFLIADSIYCLVEAVRSLKIFGQSYMSSHSYFAYTYKKLGDWSGWFRQYLELMDPKSKGVPELALADQRESFTQQITNLIGIQAIYYLQKDYYYELGKQQLYSALEVHREGAAYQTFNQNMFVLEDDFNDNFFHFCAALERFNINIGAVRKDLNYWETVARNSPSYQPEKYIRPRNLLDDRPAIFPQGSLSPGLLSKDDALKNTD